MLVVDRVEPIAHFLAVLEVNRAFLFHLIFLLVVFESGITGIEICYGLDQHLNFNSMHHLTNGLYNM